MTLELPILTQNFDSSDIAFTRIDEEIRALKETIRALLARRNTFTQSYRLPPELLTRIFSFTQFVYASDRLEAYSRRHLSLKWVVITHVSQHWRDVALSSPSLWSHISSTYPAHIFQEMLTRSKAAPLTVVLDRVSPERVQTIGDSLSRIQTLNLKLSPSCWTTLSPHLFSPAPILASLSITIYSDPDQPITGVSNSMFSGTMPQLRRLELDRCSVDITSQSFMDLTVLKLHHLPQKLSATDLFMAIRSSPCLTSLDLSDVLREGADPVSLEVDAVHLRSLHSVKIRGRSFTQDLDLLSHLVLPANAYIHFSSLFTNNSSLQILKEFLQVHHAARQLPHISLARPTESYKLTLMSFGSNLEMSVQPTRYVMSSTTPNYLQCYLIASSMDAPPGAQAYSYHIPSILPTFPLTSLDVFLTNINLDVDTWANTFGTLTNLKRISVTGLGGRNLLTAISNDFREKVHVLPSSSDVLDWEPNFPNLELLRISELVFPGKPQMDNLLYAFQARKTIKKSLKTLAIVGCTIMKEYIGGLRGVVDAVAWDGSTAPNERDVYGEDSGALWMIDRML